MDWVFQNSLIVLWETKEHSTPCKPGFFRKDIHVANPSSFEHKSLADISSQKITNRVIVQAEHILWFSTGHHWEQIQLFLSLGTQSSSTEEHQLDRYNHAYIGHIDVRRVMSLLETCSFSLYSETSPYSHQQCSGQQGRSQNICLRASNIVALT